MVPQKGPSSTKFSKTPSIPLAYATCLAGIGGLVRDVLGKKVDEVIASLHTPPPNGSCSEVVDLLPEKLSFSWAILARFNHFRTLPMLAVFGRIIKSSPSSNTSTKGAE